MNNFKNKIIAISGEPVSGKGTTVKSIIQTLQEKGYKSENIHLVAAGHEFRDWINFTVEFLKNFNNKEEAEKLLKQDFVSAVFGEKKNREIFIDAVKKLMLNGIDFSNISVEQANNMPELASIREFVDEIIDGKIRKLGEKINAKQRPEEVWILDSRLAFANIPEAFSIRLTCMPQVAGERLFNDNSRGKEDSQYVSIEDATNQREKRRIGEIERYKEIYGIDLSDEDNYDIIIDTSYSETRDISNVILKGLNAYVKGEHVAKKWASPKVFIPTQGIRDTWMGVTVPIEEVQQSIDNNGYDMNCEIETIQVDGIKYLINGHHRNFAVGMAGGTLIPYIEIGKDDEKIIGRTYTAREFTKNIQNVYLWDHEGIFDDKDKNIRFSYENIYPGIYKKIKELNEGPSLDD